ncbi:MAG: class B sortase [Clostridia bacterium]|nr:class B sortase [Clostridia bacterium]
MKKKLYTVGMILCAAAFLVFAALWGYDLYDRAQAEREFAELEAMLSATATPAPTAAPDRTPTPTPAATPTPEPDEHKYARFAAMNSDFVGWVRIDNTPLSYPVVQTKQDEQYYLRRSFYKSSSVYGTPFMDKDCTVGESQHLIIYGHHIRGDKMFGALVRYKDPAYFKAHPVIRFDTTERLANYEIFAVFLLDIENPAFNPYASTVWQSEAAFARYLELVESVRLYDTGKRPAWGDEILTLSTCETDGNYDRILVLAYRTKGE